ncbi:MAG: protein kinase [Acidobacteriaceae bacterium]|nr:protein kinase [Acidobacteriaceae bacterium]
MSLVTGTKLGPFEIQSWLGAGGMGVVYRAKDTRLGRDVAIKVLPESFARDENRLRRFEQEARALAGLNHPNILAVHDIGEQGGAPYLVSELLEGHSLRQELLNGALPTKRAVGYGTQIAEGLAAAHEKGIIHRDLKPENIFVTKDGRVKILDFGLAKLAKPEEAADDSSRLETVAEKTTPGMVLGTVGYMAPEQVKGEKADERSDIFALGTILYEMLSGKRTFRKDTSAETMTAILNEEPEELTSAGKPIAPALERIVRRCLEKKPLQRFQSARDLAFNLEGISGTTSISVAQAATTATVSGSSSRKWLFPIAAGVLLFLAGGVVLVDWLRHRGVAVSTQPIYHQQTFERGLIYAARFAPDGRMIYYSANWNGEPVQVYSKELGSPESRALNLVNSTLFAVSPSEIAISLGCKDRYIGDCQGTLALAPVSGGAPREVSEDVISADWTTEGREMAAIRQFAGKYRVEFPRGKVIYESDHPLGYVRISPRANAIAFAEYSGIFGDAARAMVVDRSGKEVTRPEAFVSLEGIAWPPSGDEVWVGATTQEGWADAIHALSLNGQRRIVLRLPGMLRLHDVSRDGRILLSKESWRSEMQFRGPGDKKERRLSWLDYATLTDLSNDGGVVAIEDWGEASGASPLAYVRKTDGSPAVKLGTWSAPVLSPDGKRVLTIEGAEVGNMRLAVIPTGVGETQMLNPNGIQTYASLGWMPDGKAVYFAGDDGNGWREYVYDIASGKIRGVTSAIDVRPAHLETHLVSPDGKYVFARNLNGQGTLYPLAGGALQPIPGWLVEDIWINWSADGHSAYVYHDDKATAEVYRLNLSTGKRDVVGMIGVNDPAGVTAIVNVRMTPDGKTYVYSYNRELSDLFLVEGVR